VSDEGKLRQALVNLVSNAVKFTDKGTVALSAMPAPSEGRALALSFTVSDTGPGIPEREISNLFRPFVQGTTGLSFGGTGLGLAITRQYAHILGGEVEVRSQVGVGSTFTLTVSAREAKAGEVTLQARPPHVLRLADGQPPVRILVADDNPMNRELIAATLGPMGFEVSGVADGLEAEAVFHEWKPHAILMDMKMPVLDGYEATRRIKATPEGQQTFILGLTASAFEEDRSAVLDSGASDFMRKPFKQDELLAVLGKQLNLRYLYSEETPPLAAMTEAAHATADFSSLPEELRAGFLKACGEADYERLVELCEQFVDMDSTAAERLRMRVNAFDYDGIAQLLAINPPLPAA
jgi:CheY-like chemotaxis protein